MAKVKISATVDPERLARAKALTGCAGTSEVIDRGLEALIEGRLEDVHVGGYERIPQGGESIQAVDAAVWEDLPWDDILPLPKGRLDEFVGRLGPGELRRVCSAARFAIQC